jgi:hypothetical protein
MWKGFTNQVADGSPEEEEREEEEQEEEEEEEDEKEDDETGEHDDGNETETPAVPTLTSRLANSVWRGITNQSSMEDEVPSPPSPSSARHSPIPPEENDIETSTPASQASLWEYAGKLKDSDTVAAFSKVSTNWRAKALDAWRVRKGSNASTSSGPVAPGQSTPPSPASEIAPRRSGWPGLSDTDAPSHRRGSLPRTQRESEHDNPDPPRPAFFRSPRESFLPQPRRQHSTASSSPNIDPTPLRDSDNESSASSFIHRAGASITSLATFPSSHSPKGVPRPLMLNSRGLITTKPSQPQSHSSARSEDRMPEYRGGVGQWGDVSLATKNRHMLRQESVSSMSSLSPSEAMNRSAYPFSGAYTQSAGTRPRSDHESDGSAAATSRKVPLNRKSVSPMALASRSPHLPWNAPSPGRSSGHPLSNESVTAEDMDTAPERGWRHFEEQVHSNASTMAPTTTGFDSPTTIASPPIPRTPLMSAVPGIVRIVNGGSTGGGRHIATSSISTLSEACEMNAIPLEPPTQNRLVRKKTPPRPVPATPDRDSHGETLPSSESESRDSELSLERTPSGKAPVRLRSKRYVQRPGNLRLRPVGTLQGTPEQRTPSPGQQSLAPESSGEYEPATTPKMESCFDEEEEEEGPGTVVSRPPIARKPSKEARLRKEARRMRDSGAEEGDDEGYDDLLSAYESEEGSRE